MPLSKKAAEETDSDDQQPDILDTPEQKRFNDLLSQIKEREKNINMSLFEEILVMTHLTKYYKLYTV